MFQAFLAWNTSHVFSMGPCCDDHRQPRRCGQSCSPGCTSPVLWHSVCADSSPGVRRRRTLPLSCNASCGQPIPKSVAATPAVIPCVRTAEPWIRRRRAPPSSCHSLRTGDRAHASSRTHLRRRVRPPRVQTARLQVRPRVPGTPTRQTPATDGDIPRGWGRVLPARGIRRRRGQQSCPRTRHLSPAAQKCPRTRRMPPAAAPEYGASVASRATGAASAPAPTSNHDFRVPAREPEGV